LKRGSAFSPAPSIQRMQALSTYWFNLCKILCSRLRVGACFTS
jgi:hypothetical protein